MAPARRPTAREVAESEESEAFVGDDLGLQSSKAASALIGYSKPRGKCASAGDVIPFVAGVLDASKRTGAERDIVPPSTCPSCGQPLTERGNSRELFCVNVACPAQTVRRLIHWASRVHLTRLRPELERLRERGLSLDVWDEDLSPDTCPAVTRCCR